MAWWRHMAEEVLVNICQDNGEPPQRMQAITRNDIDLF